MQSLALHTNKAFISPGPYVVGIKWDGWAFKCVLKAQCDHEIKPHLRGIDMAFIWFLMGRMDTGVGEAPLPKPESTQQI